MHPNETIVRTGYDAFVRGDIDAVRRFLHPDVIWHVAVLNEVLGKVPDQAKDSIQRAIDNAKKAQEKVQHGRAKNNGRKPTAPPGKGGNRPSR